MPSIECETMCNGVQGCAFVNSKSHHCVIPGSFIDSISCVAYHDVNGKVRAWATFFCIVVDIVSRNSKGGSTQLTCSLFTKCHTNPADEDNFGGQTQPDGSIDFIIDSDGWCKDWTGSIINEGLFACSKTLYIYFIPRPHLDWLIWYLQLFWNKILALLLLKPLSDHQLRIIRGV